MQKNTGKNSKLSDYIEILEKSSSDFKNVKLNYENACLNLRKTFNYLDKVIKYNNEILIYTLEYSFYKGLTDNLEHFKHPEKSTFLDMDYNDSLNEKELRNSKDYMELLKKKERLLDFLPIESESLYDIIIEYQVFLETYIPKMAHYYGFLYGNIVLINKLIEYKVDYELTKKYKEWLNIYLDLNL